MKLQVPVVVTFVFCCIFFCFVFYFFKTAWMIICSSCVCVRRTLSRVWRTYLRWTDYCTPTRFKEKEEKKKEREKKKKDMALKQIKLKLLDDKVSLPLPNS